MQLSNRDRRHHIAGYNHALSAVFALFRDEVRAQRVIMMQNPPESDEFINAHNTALVIAMVADKIKEKLAHAVKQEH